jgi:hypothetical protein
MIMAEGHGGTLLIVPDDDTSWERSLSPFVHRFIVPDATIPDLIRQDLARLATQGDVVQRVSALAVEAEEKSAILGGLSDDRPADMTLLVRPIVSLAAVDGAVVLKNDLRIIGFGAKISVKGTSSAQFFSFRPKAGGSATQCEIEDLGGTRHQSSARFVAANRNATALVISQDRHISIMSWNADVDGVAIVRNAEWWL